MSENDRGASSSAVSDDDLDLVTEIEQRYRDSRNHTSRWREKTREDYAFVAGDQWNSQDKADLTEQLRPVITFNRVGPTVDAVSGFEVSNRQEVRYIPRTLGAADVNELYTSAAKWVRDECDAEDEESDAFLDVVICGMGWTETRVDAELDDDGMIRIERFDPLEAYWDPSASKRNLGDARYVMRVRKMARSDIIAKFPDKADDIEVSEEGDFALWDNDNDADPHDREAARNYDSQAASDMERGRGMLTVVHYQTFDHKEVYRVADPFDPSGQRVTEMRKGEFEKFSARAAKLGLPVQAARRTKRVFREAFLCGRVVLWSGETACQHGFTLKCITGKRDRNHNTWYGLVRAMKDPQRWANKWLSQTLDIMNSNAKGGIMAEKDAFENPRKAEEGWATPRSITWTNPGAIANGKIKEKPQAVIPAGFQNLTEFAISSIRDVTGVNVELLGMADREQAGVLEAQRKQAGLTILATLFDSLRRYRKEQGRVLLYFVNEYIPPGKLIRIAGPDGEQYVPFMKDQGTITYDVIVDEASTSPNQKEQVFAVLMQLLPMVSKMGMPLTPDMMDYLPLPASLVSKWKQEVQQRKQQGPPPNPAMVKAMGEQQYQQGKLRLDMARALADIEGVRAAALVNLAKAGALQSGADLDRFNAILDAISGQADQQHSQALDVADMAHGQAIDRADLALRQQQAGQQAAATAPQDGAE